MGRLNIDNNYREISRQNKKLDRRHSKRVPRTQRRNRRNNKHTSFTSMTTREKRADMEKRKTSAENSQRNRQDEYQFTFMERVDQYGEMESTYQEIIEELLKDLTTIENLKIAEDKLEVISRTIRGHLPEFERYAPYSGQKLISGVEKAEDFLFGKRYEHLAIAYEKSIPKLIEYVATGGYLDVAEKDMVVAEKEISEEMPNFMRYLATTTGERLREGINELENVILKMIMQQEEKENFKFEGERYHDIADNCRLPLSWAV